MGNGSAKLIHYFSVDARHRQVTAAVMSETYDEGLGHSFCYIRPNTLAAEETTTFRTISGASISANTATSLSTALADLAYPLAVATAFKISTSFSSVPLQPVPRFSSGPLSDPLAPADWEFLSGPIERGFMSGPLDHYAPSGRLPQSRSHSLALRRCSCCTAASLLRGLTKGIARTMPPPSPRPPPPPFPPVAAPYPTPCATSFLYPPLPLPPRDLPLVTAPPPCDLLRRPFPCPPPRPLPMTFLWSPPPTSPRARPPSSACPPRHSPLPTTFLWSPPPLPATSSAVPSPARPPLLAASSAARFPARPPPRNLSLVVAAPFPLRDMGGTEHHFILIPVTG